MYLTVGSYNLAHWLTKGQNRKLNIAKTKDKVRDLIDRHGVIGLQECGPREYKDMCLQLENEGYGLYWGPNGGFKQGMRSTPILWRKNGIGRVKVVGFDSQKLTPELKIAKGAGPTLIKPKYAHAIIFEYQGRKVVFINAHGLASLWAQPRWFWAKRFFRKLAEFVDSFAEREYLVLVVGDFNCKYDSKWRQPLREVGLRSLQAAKGPLITHPPKGVIDDVEFRLAPRRMLPEAIHTINGPSDHHALIGIFKVRPQGFRWSGEEVK